MGSPSRPHLHPTPAGGPGSGVWPRSEEKPVTKDHHSPEPSRYLVVANLTAESPTLQERVRAIVARDPDAVFELVVPIHLTSWSATSAAR